MTNWIQRVNEERSRLDENLKLRLIRATLMYTTPYLSTEEVEIFLTPQENLSNPDTLIAYSDIEKKVSVAYSGGYDETSKKWRRIEFIKEMKDILGTLYSDSELKELEALLIGPWDINAFVMGIAGDNYGMRRIRNAYLPEITDLIEVNLETGQGRDLTKELFKEGPEDAVSRIQKIIRLEEE